MTIIKSRLVNLCICYTVWLRALNVTTTISVVTASFFSYCKKVQMLKCDIICDPQRRSRTAEVFGQFGGESCQDSLGDREFCVTNAKCDLPPPPPCSDSEFQCESGISPSFKSPTVPLSLLF